MDRGELKMDGLTLKQITPKELRDRYHVQNGKRGHFFDRSTMNFFGDTWGNYGCQPVLVKCKYSDEISQAHELFRRLPVNGGLFDSRFFTDEGKLLIGVEKYES